MVKDFYHVLKVKLVCSLKPSMDNAQPGGENFSRSGNGVCHKSFNTSPSALAIAAVGTTKVGGK